MQTKHNVTCFLWFKHIANVTKNRFKIKIFTKKNRFLLITIVLKLFILCWKLKNIDEIFHLLNHHEIKNIYLLIKILQGTFTNILYVDIIHTYLKKMLK